MVTQYKNLINGEMIETGEVMMHADTASQYIEIDTQQDFDFARRCWTATGIDYE